MGDPQLFRITYVELPTWVAGVLVGRSTPAGGLWSSPCCWFVMSSWVKSQLWSFDPLTHVWSVNLFPVRCLFLIAVQYKLPVIEAGVSLNSKLHNISLYFPLLTTAVCKYLLKIEFVFPINLKWNSSNGMFLTKAQVRKCTWSMPLGILIWKLVFLQWLSLIFVL